MALDIEALREEFPILKREVDGKPLVYLDNAATTQKPQCVIDAIVHYYSYYNANVHRGAHRLADEATKAFEEARDILASFINAYQREEVIWTSGTTESINIVSHGLAQLLQPGDEVLVTEMEHHADLVTWQQACLAAGASLKAAPILDSGELDIGAFEALLGPQTKLVAFPHASNALGTLNPIKELTAKAKAVGAWVLIDGAQGIAHETVDVQAIGCDFYAFSAHKIYGPMGIGVLWGREELLREWPVWQTGGEMISTVTYQTATWNQLPYKFEAGTPNVADAIAFGRAVAWYQQLNREDVHAHEQALLASASQQLAAIEGLTLVGTAPSKVSVVSFIMAGGHPADIGFLLDRQGIAIRTGHHCAEPLMNRLGLPGTARASFAIYNTQAEVDALAAGLRKVQMMLM
ncbi:cysteine desulfurase [Halioxenophilus sp. WMMB6]|uniref:aminotransferase class V-fold PLP-dependent enzyme n=1 Tax=Halioxenophilus sp. WMMB6 TaxID=3073815 RepID=UPI00295E5C3F|nr:cysteine desulfurase [Halioxenophilus sp. WMMB6]